MIPAFKLLARLLPHPMLALAVAVALPWGVEVGVGHGGGDRAGGANAADAARALFFTVSSPARTPSVKATALYKAESQKTAPPETVPGRMVRQVVAGPNSRAGLPADAIPAPGVTR
jgi:hypothetical protein